MKHLSLDFWNTLGQPNPAYVQARNAVLASFYGTPAEEADKVYKTAKAMIDKTHCATTRAMPFEMCFRLLDFMMNEQLTKQVAAYRETVVEGLERAFRAHPPTLVPEAIEQLLRIQATGMTISITSNTNFVRGALIREVVLEPAIRFDFYLFSDEIGYAKPHPEIWHRLLARTALPRKDITHMGDNLVCDIDGARAMKIVPSYVPNPIRAASTLKVLADQLEKEHG